MLTDDVAAIRDDPDVRVVAEVMGGVEPTRAYLLQLFEAGKSVVSANKQLLARHGEELFAAAERHGVQLRFEASVCAAIPVVKVLRESMIASDVDGVLGIVNGTTNYILTAMDQGQDYASALARAQELGYAEADPTEDVNGADAAAKIAILASIAFHTRVTIDDVPHSGIDALEPLDVAHAAGARLPHQAHRRGAAHGAAASWRACTPRSCTARIRWPASTARSTPSCCAARPSARSRWSAPARAARRRRRRWSAT